MIATACSATSRASDAPSVLEGGGQFREPEAGGIPVRPACSEDNKAGSDVTRYRPSDKSVTVVKSKIGFKIVGAGVSTCAPTTAPR